MDEFDSLMNDVESELTAVQSTLDDVESILDDVERLLEESKLGEHDQYIGLPTADADGQGPAPAD